MWKVPLVDIPFEPPALGELESMISSLEEPLGDLAPLLVRTVSRAARADGIKVLMSGAGGDDVFSGYRRHLVARLWDKLPMLAPLAGAAARATASIFSGARRRRVERFGEMVVPDSEETLHRLFVFNAPERVRAIAGDSLRSRPLDGSDWLRDGLRRTRGAPMLERTLAGEFLGFVPDLNLAYTDKASMSEGVEVRVPLLDPALARFASRLHPDVKMGLAGPKTFFKQAMADRLPAALLRRTKTGFGVPLRHWLMGGLREPFLDIVRSRRFRERGLFHSDAVERMFGDRASRSITDPYLILAIVMVELWCRRFADGSQDTPLPAPMALQGLSAS
jgi:asparagine synthase (glutamine-hydrolysing)